MASTTKWSDGTFRISFNPEYVKAERVALVILLHEQCHVETSDEGPLFDDSEGHYPAWQNCMLRVDKQGAFRKILIDGYEGK